MKTLQLVTTAYRATLEEQDDTILWLTEAMKTAGADLDLLLVGDAVNYALADQDASGLAFGAWQQSQPPLIAEDLKRLMTKGVKVMAVREDLDERGLGRARCIDGVAPIAWQDAAGLMTRDYPRVWYW